jgi:hypothetical protein
LQADANGLVSAIGNASFITDMISMVTKPVWERVNDLVYLIPAIKQVAIGITDKIT